MTSSYLIHDQDGNLIASETINGGDGTSNQAEYIGLLYGVEQAIRFGVKHVKIIGDSELIINQVKGNYKCKNANLIIYRDRIQQLLKDFFWTHELNHVNRKLNKQADKLCRGG
jgi:ribonuclease HI